MPEAFADPSLSGAAPRVSLLRKHLTISLLALVLATGAVALAPRSAAAQSAPAQRLPEAWRKLDKLSVSPAAVRYYDLTFETRQVAVYTWVKNTSGKPVLLTRATFESTLTQAGHTIDKTANGSSPIYNYATGLEAGQISGDWTQRTLQPDEQVLIAISYPVTQNAMRSPLTWTLREKPLIALPGKTGGVATSMTGPGYSPPQTPTPDPKPKPEPGPADPGPKAPPPPPARPLPTKGLQNLPALSSIPMRLGTWAIRVESISYDLRPDTKTGTAVVRLTMQNVQTAPAKLKADWLKGFVGPDANNWSHHKHMTVDYNGMGIASVEVGIPYGEAADLAFGFELSSEASLRALRQFQIRLAVSGTEATTAIPAFTLSTASKSGSPPATPPPETTLPTPPSKPLPSVGLQTSPGASSEFSPLGPWRLRVDSISYDIRPESNPGIAIIRTTVQNTTGDTLKLQAEALRGFVSHNTTAWSSHSKSEILVGGATYSGSTDVSVPAGAAVDVHFTFGMPSETRLRALRDFQLSLAATPTRQSALASASLPPFTAPNPNAPPPPPPPPTPAPPIQRDLTNAEIDAAQAFTGVYDTNRGTQQTFVVDSRGLTGRARAPDGQNRETVVLFPQGGGKYQGVWRELTNNGVVQGTATLTFDAEGFRGHVVYATVATGFTYEGQRPRAGGPSKPGDQTGGDGFTPTAYLDLKIDRVGRSSLGGVEVVMTARNTEEVRKGVQYDTQKYVVLGSDGVEYGTDGNYYGHSSAEKLRDTIWIFKDAQATATYLFPRVPNGVKATRLILRENGRQTAAFDLPAQGQGGGVHTPGSGSQPPAGAAVRIGEYDVAFVSLQKGDDGDWESTWSLTNRTQTTTAVQLNDLSVTLTDSGGRSATGGGPYHYAGETGRRVRRSGFEIAPGEETRVRIWHSGSGQMTPSAYMFSVRGQMAQGTLDAVGAP